MRNEEGKEESRREQEWLFRWLGNGRVGQLCSVADNVRFRGN